MNRFLQLLTPGKRLTAEKLKWLRGIWEKQTAGIPDPKAPTLPEEFRTVSDELCPYCGKAVTYRIGNNGWVVGDPEYVLIANWLYHSKCWDRQMERFPP